MADLLLELFSEEIPARMQRDAIEHLAEALRLELSKSYALWTGDKLQRFVTPRRLCVYINALPATQSDTSTERKGPRVDAPQQAIDGFLRSTGLTLEQLEKRDGVYFASIHQKGRPTAEVLKEIIERILTTFPWPKSMRWGSGDVTWVRPLHNILCIFDGKVVPVEFAGLKANNHTYGHRFLAPKAMTIKKAEDYEKALEKAFVIADFDRRKAEVKKQAEALAAKHKLTLRPDEALLEEVTGLVEWPVALLGGIDKEFMDIPPEVLVTVMRNHQRYFALSSPHPNPLPQAGEGSAGAARAGEGSNTLAPHFILIANRPTEDGGKAVVAGNERVIRARFADAKFFWDQDRKKSLDEWAEGLANVTFHAKLGTVADKVERITALAVQIASYLPSPVGGGSGRGHDTKDRASTPPTPPPPYGGRSSVERAAQLCKADLVTGMVGEFAELQGVMGRYYALHMGEKPDVADAVRDHYKPLGPNDACPTAPVSVCVALADKIDTLVGMFAIGEKPTGSKDPFALRRAALGVIRIILENGIRLGLQRIILPQAVCIHRALLDKFVNRTADLIGQQIASDIKKGSGVAVEAGIAEPDYANCNTAAKGTAVEIVAFLADRLKVQLKDQGIRHDLISAVFALGEDDLVRLVARVRALQSFLETEDGGNLLVAYRRAANILRIEEKKDQRRHDARPDAAKLAQPEEKQLFEALEKTLPLVQKALDAEDFTGAMTKLAELRRPVDAFFDKVTVNAEDAALRENRLRLLALIRGTLDTIADFSAIEGDTKEQKKAA